MKRKRRMPPPSERELTLLPGITEMVSQASGAAKAVEVAVSMARASAEMQTEEVSTSQRQRASKERGSAGFERFTAWAGVGAIPSVRAALSYTATWEPAPDDRTVRRWISKLRKKTVR
jgi:hypothetical protein